MPVTGIAAERNRTIGIGATYEGRDPELLACILPLVEYIEVTLETISELRDGKLTLAPEIMTELKSIGRDAEIIVHGVTLSIGSHDGWSSDYLDLLDMFTQEIEVAWHSEHLGYTKVDGEHLGIMLAMPKTEEALDLVSERVLAIQRRVQLPFLLENIVHVIPDFPGQYSDAAFLNALADRTGVGLILDVYNLECDAHNHGFDIEQFVRELHLDRVHEMHVACGVEHNGFLLDVHSKAPRQSTLDLARRVATGPAARPEVVVYEFMPEAVPGLGTAAIADALKRLRTAVAS